MKPELNVLEAMLHCPYKAWKLAKEPFSASNGETEYYQNKYNPVSTAALRPVSTRVGDGIKSKPPRHSQKAHQLLADTEAILRRPIRPPSINHLPSRWVNALLGMIEGKAVIVWHHAA